MLELFVVVVVIVVGVTLNFTTPEVATGATLKETALERPEVVGERDTLLREEGGKDVEAEVGEKRGTRESPSAVESVIVGVSFDSDMRRG